MMAVIMNGLKTLLTKFLSKFYPKKESSGLINARFFYVLNFLQSVVTSMIFISCIFS